MKEPVTVCVCLGPANIWNLFRRYYAYAKTVSTQVKRGPYKQSQSPHSEVSSDPLLTSNHVIMSVSLSVQL